MIPSKTKADLVRLFLLLFCLFQVACAAAPKSALDEAPPDPKHFLWSVRSESATVYLLGSIHVAKAELYPLPRAIEAAFDQSDTLVLEVNPAEFDQSKLQALFFRHGLYPPGETLDRKVAEETYTLAEKKFKESGMPIGPLSQFKPWVLAVMLQAAELQRLGFDKQYGIDEHFLVQAQGKKRSPRSRRSNTRSASSTAFPTVSRSFSSGIPSPSSISSPARWMRS